MACKYTYNRVEYSKEQLVSKLSNENSNFQTLYNNLVNEITNTETGRKILDRIKKDYVKKVNKVSEKYDLGAHFHINGVDYGVYGIFEPEYYKQTSSSTNKVTISEQEYLEAKKAHESFIESDVNKYTLEEQQEEAIVELLGMMTAEKLDAVKDGKLISLLKRLLKEMKAFVRTLLNQKEINIDNLPDNITINDLADLLAYSNSKLILPGYEVEYTTPDDKKFKTYAEASNHISELAKNVQDVDLNNVNINIIENKDVVYFIKSYDNGTDADIVDYYVKLKDDYYVITPKAFNNAKDFLNDPIKFLEKVKETKYSREPIKINSTTFNKAKESANIEFLGLDELKLFIEKNKEYEQSKEIIEEWKKVNNIVYNPEEIYSRGQEFVSVVGAYSLFDVNLMMQNLLQHIEDNEKADGKFAISAFTKPIDKTIGHLESGGGKIKFKIYPKSEDILWATNRDAYSGSVWDASEKVNKDKKSELLGVSYTKYPALHYVNTVQPNLAAIIDDLAHHHNELGIVLTSNNFRLEYDEDIPYQTKKIIDGINSILDQKYGKLVKPIISSNNNKTIYRVISDYNIIKDFYDIQEAELFVKEHNDIVDETDGMYYDMVIVNQDNSNQIQTENNLQESIENVKYRILYGKNTTPITKEIYDSILSEEYNHNEDYIKAVTEGEYWRLSNGTYFYETYRKEKEYTEQALINLRVAKLKEVTKKYPRILIRSEVKKINEHQFDELSFFQKIPINVEKLFEDEKFANEIYEALNFFDINIDGVAVNYNKDDFEKAAIKAYNEIIRDLNGEIAGLYDGTTIFVDDSLDNEEKLRVIKHEVAHSLYNEKSYIIEDLVSIINGKIEKDLIDNYYKPLVEERRAKKLGLNFEVNDLARMITNDPILSLKVKLFNENINAKEFIADILSRKSHRDFYFSNYPIETFNILNLIQHITPQQKQEAIHLYSQYLKQNPNGDIENFKSWIEEFKNKIYESLGYKVKQEFKSEPELLTVENETISGKENESFFEMQQTGIKNINIRKRIELAQQYNIIQGQSYSFFEIKKIFNNELLFNNDIYKQLEKILNSDLTFKFGSLNTGKKTINAYYNSNSNSINIDTLVLKTPNLAVSDFKRILLHEIIHAATFINLSENANLTITQKIALNNLNNVIEELNKDKDFFGQYGLKSANELLAELANDEFVKKLKNKKFDNNKNFFEKIISEIVKFLGLKTSAYDIVKESFDNLVKDYTDNQLTPQQKQEAIHLYSKYVELNPNGNIEEFKSWVNEFKQSTKVPFQITEKQKENIKPLPTDLIDYLNDLSTKSNKDILEEIKLNSSDEDLHKVIDVLVNNVGKIKFVKFKGLEPLEDNNNQAEYDGETGEIFVNSIAYQDGKVDVKDNLNRAIIHEYVHGFFLSVLKNPKTKQEKELVKYINEAYNTLISDYEDTDKWYGFTNVSEFVSELLSNKKFRESEQVKKTGIIQKIVNFINNLYFKKYGKTAVEIKENTFNKILDNIHILQPSLIDSNGIVGNSLIDFISEKSEKNKSFSQFQESLNNPNTNPILIGTTSPDVILPIGTSGSGKSTFIKSLPQENLVVIEPDAMRVEFTGNMNDKSKDKEIYEEAAKRAIQAIKQGKQVVFDTTNLTKEKRLPFIEAIKKEIPTANIQYKLMELNPELAKQRIKAQIERGENRANVSEETIDRHAESYKQMLEDIKNEPITNFDYKEEQLKKFNELQELISNNEFIQGAKLAFESSDLKDYGTLENYIDYVAKISLGIIRNPTSGEFNNSIIKDIVYHGAMKQLINRDSKFKGYVTYFSTNKNYAETFGFPINREIIQALLNITSPYNATSNLADVPEEIHSINKFTNARIIKSENLGYDSVIGVDAGQKDGNTIAVFEPEQIHILSSKQDIEGFKDFVTQSSTTIKPEIQKLFNSNPELVNKVYETLGIKTASIEFKIEPFGKSIDNIEIFKDGKKFGDLQIVKNNKNNTLIVSRIEIREKGFGKYIYLKLQEQYPDLELRSDSKALSNDAVNMWDSFVKKGLAIKNAEKDYTLNIQQVIQLYSQYLDTGRGDIEGFKDFVNNKKNEVVKESNNQSLQDGLQWLKQIMPDVEPLLVDGLIDNIANGKYDILNDVITLSEDFANKGVVKEEVFHRWWEKMIPNQTEVENILNEKIENREITKDCKNDFKATQGLTTTTNGTNWSIIEDLKGNSHKLGGIDLTIGEDGISFKNNNSDIKAQDGLLIPSDKNKTNNYDNEFLNNWYKNRQIQDSYIQEAFELDKPEYLKKIEKYPEVKVVDKIDNNPNITGQYNKEKNEIYLTKDAEDSTLTHEQNHYINDFESYMKTIHDNIVKNEIKPIEDITHNGVKKNYDYLSNSNEIHSRIMILREKAGFKPNEFINEEKLDNYLKTYKGDVSNIEDLLYLMKDKKSLLNMLNYMAYNSNNNTENNA